VAGDGEDDLGGVFFFFYTRWRGPGRVQRVVTRLSSAVDDRLTCRAGSPSFVRVRGPGARCGCCVLRRVAARAWRAPDHFPSWSGRDWAAVPRGLSPAAVLLAAAWTLAAAVGFPFATAASFSSIRAASSSQSGLVDPLFFVLQASRRRGLHAPLHICSARRLFLFHFFFPPPGWPRPPSPAAAPRPSGRDALAVQDVLDPSPTRVDQCFQLRDLPLPAAPW